MFVDGWLVVYGILKGGGDGKSYCKAVRLTCRFKAVPHFAAALEEIAYVEASSDSRLVSALCLQSAKSVLTAERQPSGVINFRRYRHIGRVCSQLTQFQLTPFNLTPIAAVQNWYEPLLPLTAPLR